MCVCGVWSDYDANCFCLFMRFIQVQIRWVCGYGRTEGWTGLFINSGVKFNLRGRARFQRWMTRLVPQCRRWLPWWGKCRRGHKARRRPFAQCTVPHPDAQIRCPGWRCRSLREIKEEKAEEGKDLKKKKKKDGCSERVLTQKCKI